MNFNILGIGLPQLLIVLAVALMLFGPKKMIEWAYIAGRYLAKMRTIYQHTMDEFQKEVADAGLNVNDITKDMPSFDILNEANKVVNSATSAAAATDKPAAAKESPEAATPANPDPSSEQESKYDAWLPK